MPGHEADPSTATLAARRPAGKGVPPPRHDVLGAIQAAPAEPIRKPSKDTVKSHAKGRTEPLNFRVAADFRRAFKRAAAAQDCKKVELLERIFAEWRARNQ